MAQCPHKCAPAVRFISKIKTSRQLQADALKMHQEPAKNIIYCEGE